MLTSKNCHRPCNQFGKFFSVFSNVTVFWILKICWFLLMDEKPFVKVLQSLLIVSVIFDLSTSS